MKNQSYARRFLLSIAVVAVIAGPAIQRARESLAAIMDSPWFWSGVILLVVLVVLSGVILWKRFSNGGGITRGRM